MPVKHSFNSGVADGGNAALVQPSNWNADHSIDSITAIQDAQTPLTFTRFFANFVCSYNGYVQVAVQNKSAGASGSSDFVATTNTGTDTTEYIDMGINGSGYSGTWGGPKDGYLYVDGGAASTGDLHLGTQQAGSIVAINVGGGADANRVVQFNGAGMVLTSFAADPATPAADTMAFYPKKIGGRVMPKWMGPSGVDTPFQPFLGMNSINCVTTGTGTTAALVCTTYGAGFTAGGTGTITYAQTVPTTGSLKSRTRLSTLSPAAVSGNLSYVKSTTVVCARETGFFLVMRFGLDTMCAGQRGFFGLWGSATALTNIDTNAAITAKCGLSFNLNTGNWFLSYATGAAVTNTDLGASFPLNGTDLMELILFSAPGGSVISYRVTNMTTGATVSGDLSGNLPPNTTYMSWQMFMTCNTTVAVTKWSFKSAYLETDY